MIVALLSFTQGLKQTAAGFVHLGGSDLGIFQANVSDPTASLLPESLVARVASRPDVSAATPLVLIVEGLKSDPGAIVFGADPSGFFYRGLVLTAGHAPVAGTQQVLVGDRLASSPICRSARGDDQRAPLHRQPASTTPASCSRTPARCSSSRRPRR